ncbi:MAG: DUF3391 domain-containing protein, partial [Burkholderiaceae bacterium]|nr:DUF3391 domain-containing protein [Burkholderiaceae bacterium]
MHKTIRVDQLRLGMHLHSLGGAWLDHPFWQTSFVLQDPADLRELRASGIKECVIDAARGLDVEPEPMSPLPTAAPTPAAPAALARPAP